MSKFELTVEQYMSVIRFELAKRLSSRCVVSITNNRIDGLHSIRIIWDDWNFEIGLEVFQTCCKNGIPVEDCVKSILTNVKSEFVKQLLKQ